MFRKGTAVQIVEQHARQFALGQQAIITDRSGGEHRGTRAKELIALGFYWTSGYDTLRLFSIDVPRSTPSAQSRPACQCFREEPDHNCEQGEHVKIGGNQIIDRKSTRLNSSHVSI